MIYLRFACEHEGCDASTELGLKRGYFEQLEVQVVGDQFQVESDWLATPTDWTISNETVSCPEHG